MNKLVKV